MNPNDLVPFLYSNLMNNVAMAWLPGLVGSKRGRSFWVGFFLSLVVSWLPALMIMSVLPPSRRRLEPRAEGLEDLKRENRRMDEAQRRAQSAPATPSPDHPPRSRTDAKAMTPPRREASPPAQPLPPPSIEPLPADLHPDPLADAPRATLRGDGPTATRSGGASTASTTAQPSALPDRLDDAPGSTPPPPPQETTSDTPDAPATAPRKVARPGTLSADGSM